MNIDDSRLIVRFQRLITEMLVEKQLGQRRPELTDEVYQTWREVEQRGLKETPEYRDVLLTVDQHALWLAGLVRLAAPPLPSSQTERTDTLDAPKKPLTTWPICLAIVVQATGRDLRRVHWSKKASSPSFAPYWSTTIQS